MKTCTWGFVQGTDEPCGEVCEGRTEFCATHNRQLRKESENTKREAEKRARIIEMAKKKNQEPRKLPNKVSPKREELNKEYFRLVEQFKKDNPNCNARINNYCTGKTDDPHHSRGRGVYLLDVSTWIPVCRSCHNYIEQHPSDAMKRGLSFSRLEPKRIFESETTEQLKAKIDELIDRQKDNEFQDVVNKRFNDMI